MGDVNLWAGLVMNGQDSQVIGNAQLTAVEFPFIIPEAKPVSPFLGPWLRTAGYRLVGVESEFFIRLMTGSLSLEERRRE